MCLPGSTNRQPAHRSGGLLVGQHPQRASGYRGAVAISHAAPDQSGAGMPSPAGPGTTATAAPRTPYPSIASSHRGIGTARDGSASTVPSASASRHRRGR